MESEMFVLPDGFPGPPGAGKCRVVPANRRKFGAFQEKTLVCNRAAKRSIDELCQKGGFTQAWLNPRTPGTQETYTMTKIPAIILVKLMRGLGPDQEAVVESLVGAYSICMDPQVRTCMNVIVGRRSDGRGGFVLDKFSLYYPDNSAVSGNNWDLLQGYSFRTAALTGSLNRAGLRGLRNGSIPVAKGTKFEASKYGLVIDRDSEYEDCAYVKTWKGETTSDRKRRIDRMVDGMVAAYGSQGILQLSYDPAERQQGITALESEWILLKRVAAEGRPLSQRRLRELDDLQRSRIDDVRLVPRPAIGRESDGRRFSVFLTAQFDDGRGRRPAPGRRENTVSLELELQLQPDFPESPPILRCLTPGVRHWSLDRAGRIDIIQLIEWSPTIQLTSLLQTVRQNLLRDMELSLQRPARRRSTSPRRAATAVGSALARAMSGDWCATGHSDGTDTQVKGFQEELEQFTLDVRDDGHVTGRPTFDVDRRDDFTLDGSVKPDSHGRLCLTMRQVYQATGSVTNWTARVGDDGTTLTDGIWSGSCKGTFKAERDQPPAQTTFADRLMAAHREVVVGRAPEPEPENEPEPEPEPSATASTEREHILWELARSEDKYNKDLQSLKTYRAEIGKQLPREDVESLFPGLDDIVALNHGFDEELNDALGSCPDATAALAVRYGGICSLFINVVPKMKCYKSYVQSLLSARTGKLLARPEVTDTVARVAARSAMMPSFDVVRMAPVRRVESYKALFGRLLQLTERTAPEYRDIRDINTSLDNLVERDISPQKPRQDRLGGKFVKIKTADNDDLRKVRQEALDRAEQRERLLYGNPPSYDGGSTMDQIAQVRQEERFLKQQADQDCVDQMRLQRLQQLELQQVVEEVVAMGYDRELVEKVQLVEQHSSPLPLARSVESESPKHHQAPPPKFVGISNPSHYCFLNATVQCLRHMPQLVAHLMDVAAPARGSGPAESLIEAFVALLKRMDRDYGSGVQDNDRARQDFLHQCLKLLPAQSGEETEEWFWCWQDDNGSFNEYDESTAEVIERAYQLKRQEVLLKLSRGQSEVEYAITNLQGARDGVRWQINTATDMWRRVERRRRRVTGEPTRIVETDWRKQRQQDAGQFLLLLLDQFATDTDSRGSAILGRMLTRPPEKIRHGITSPRFIELLNQAVQEERPEEENQLLKQFADQQWDSNTTDSSRRTAIGKFFQGQSMTLKKCLKCGRYSPCTADPFIIDHLPMHPLARKARGSLEELLADTSAPKIPTDYRCDHCQEIGRTTVMTALVRLPRIYIVQLNRANRTALGAETRVDTSIDFPDELNLAGTGRLLWPHLDTQRDYHGDPCGAAYRLVAAVFHRGTSIRTGHYYATIRASAGGSGASPTARSRRGSPSPTRSRSPGGRRPSPPRSRSPGRTGSPGRSHSPDRGGGGDGRGWVKCDDIHLYTDAPCPQDEEFDRVRPAGGRAVLLFYERIGATRRTADV